MSSLARFKSAQGSPYSGFDSALDEIRSGRKRSHWIWYIFPQIDGLGTSPRSVKFAIGGEDEAIEYLRDAWLRSNLLFIASAVAEQLGGPTRSLRTLMGSDIDAQKVVSSLTLFRHVAGKLYQIEGLDEYRAIVTVADTILAAAASEGYQPCAYTLQRLRSNG